MKQLLGVLILAFSLGASAQTQPPTTLKGVLLEQLRTTHNVKDWFVDGNTAAAGLTAEQASWKPAGGDHSIGQLLSHINYWNLQNLARLKGETPAKFSGNNDDTFNYDSKKWTETVHQFDQVMTELEKIVENADDKKLAAMASTIAHIGAHNAYHIGEIVVVRKLQGSWNPENGVK
jgi:uncharacterized damage-inducible protein DinB